MYTSNYGSQPELENGYNNEFELSPEFNFSNESGNGYQNEYHGEQESSDEFESPYELSPEFETFSLSNESQDHEISYELLQVTNEFEFGNWLKKLAKKGAGAALGFLNGPQGQQMISSLNNIAKKTLPALGERAGNYFGQRVGSMVGGNFGNQISQYASQGGKQLGQSVADRVPAFVNFAKNTLHSIANEIASGQQPQVKQAIIRSASTHYPIILQVKGRLYAKPISNARPTSREYPGEMEFEDSSEFESDNEQAVLSEVDEMELASELLSVTNEMELDMFLGKLFKKVTGAVSKFAKSGIGKSLGGILKNVAGKALPILGGVLGSAIPIPGVGTMVGSALGSAAGKLFGLELEGLSAEDMEFETARAYVRLASNATRRASRIRNMPPSHGARMALIRSAKRYAPGIIRLRKRYPAHRRPFGINYSPYFGYPTAGWVPYPVPGYPVNSGANPSFAPPADQNGMIDPQGPENGYEPDESADTEASAYGSNW